MTTIIKNQIVKQLARFTKNLSPSKISLKFLKGEGELRNLELNEAFLTDLLELPPFIRLTRAVCNRISAKIHWTRLKTDPIRLFLDCVEVEMEMTENGQEHETDQSNAKQTNQANPAAKPSEYGFVEKVVDGMLVTINSVIMAFRTPTFKATFQMSHLSVHSTDPNWKKASLRHTRIKDDAGKEVLTFKQITFGTLRVDADALYKCNGEEETVSSSPLRLITSSAILNIVIKKRIADCSVVSARLHVILDDVLWVLTHAQLRAVAGFAKSVVQVVEKSKKCEPAPSVASDDSFPSPHASVDNVSEQHHSPQSDVNHDKNPSSLFQRVDVKETSYRVTTGKIDVHLCDDSSLDDDGQSGGSMQIVVNNLSFEHYPYHLAFTSRVNWPSHNEASLTRAQWVQELFNSYKKTMEDAVKKNSRKSPNQKLDSSSPNQTTSRQVPDSREKISLDLNSSSKKRSRVYLYECAFVISCEEFIIMPVATNEKMSSTNTPFLCSDKKSLYLPSDMSALQFDYTLYFYPGQEDAKVPQPNLFCQLNPLHLTMDDLTCIWFHKFMQSIRSGFLWAEEIIAAQGAAPRHIDVRIDGLMPKLTLPCPSEENAFYGQFRPQALQVHMSSFRASNTRIGSEFKQSDLVNTLEAFLRSKLYTKADMFPNHPQDVHPLPQFSWLNDFSVCTSMDNVESYLNGIKENITGTNTSVVWMLNTRQCWCDFIGVEETGGRPRPFIEPFPLRLCMCYPIGNFVPEKTRVQNISPGSLSQGQYLPKPTALPLHRCPSDPYCRQPRNNGKSSSARTTPLSSPGLVRNQKSRSTTSVNIPVLQSDRPQTTVTHASQSSLSRSCSEESSDSFLEDRPGSRQSIDNRTGNNPNEGKPKAGWVSNPSMSSVSGNESVSDGVVEVSCDRSNGGVLNEDVNSRCGLSILLYVPSVLGAKLDHFQFVFLMRLQERFLALRDVLFADLEKFEVQRRKLQEGEQCKTIQDTDDGQGIFVALVSKGAEVSLLVPAPNEEVAETVEGKNDPCKDQVRESNEKLSRVGDPPAEIKNESKPVSPEVSKAESIPTEEVKGLEENSEWTIVDRDGQVKTCEDREGHVRTFQDREGRVRTSEDREGCVTTSENREGRIRTSEDRERQRASERRFSDVSSTNMSLTGSESSSQTRSSSLTSERSFRGRTVSTIIIRAKIFECSVTSNVEDFAFKLLVSDCAVKEGGQQNIEAFLSRKVKNDTKENRTSSRKPSEVKVRYALGSTIDQSIDGAVENGVAHVVVSDVVAEALMSSLDGLLECIQDEVLLPPPFIPVVIDIRDLNVTINSDTPSRLLSIPPPLPLILYVDHATVLRTATGAFEVKSGSSTEEMTSRVLAMRNDNLRLLKDLDMSKDARESLEGERERLVLTVQRLTEELVRSNRENDELHGLIRQLKKN